ncbi:MULTISPECIES: DUF397 domain-containing protein [Streptomyces]|uniref:DUF397 domain-containing protein n=2 Tax=Streptomyces TaxID=1883 RepID=A0A3R7LN19_9ACTN|nr:MULTISPECIES: DUF397 domain-containing protein [Streptomyces]KNE79734.1 AbaA-like protein [Streptomyces fradiae]OFA34212.1 DUF397 domain-containing protein [Streptomyces fradiae]PQM21348.1 DUF397 domain-containing protein [Streptomyces xinghaiensis]RKM93715.1 DUF397 domain-containing protein [Streptomyces xinghaiensis]RNC71480.1 DUF397 domain-containing protein [Streptomyces xinghaiensis]
MDRVHSAARELGRDGWLKPWSGDNGGSCVEALRLDDGRIAVRQSEDPDGPALLFTLPEIEAFARGWPAGKAQLLSS